MAHGLNGAWHDWSLLWLGLGLEAPTRCSWSFDMAGIDKQQLGCRSPHHIRHRFSTQVVVQPTDSHCDLGTSSVRGGPSMPLLLANNLSARWEAQPARA